MSNAPSREATVIDCEACKGTGKVAVPPEIDTIDVFYFGCWEQAGHYWRDPTNGWTPEREIERRVPAAFHHGRIDSGFCPGRVPGQPYKRSRPEVEGQAAIEHVDGWTVLAWWDRSIDGRAGCNSNIVARGLFDFTTMLEIGRRRVASVMQRQRGPVTLVEDRCTTHARSKP